MEELEGLPKLDRIVPASDEGSEKIINLEYPEEDNDGVTKGYVDISFSNSILTLDFEVLILNGNVLILR